MRDAIAAALTARDYDHDRFDAFGDSIVPRTRAHRAEREPRFRKGG